MKSAYARTTTDDQTTALQLAALKIWAVNHRLFGCRVACMV